MRLTIASWSRFTPPVIMEGLDPRAGGAAAAATQRAALIASTRLQFPPQTGPADAYGALQELSTCVLPQYLHLGDITVLTSPIHDGGRSDHARRSADCITQPVRCCGSPARVAPSGVQSKLGIECPEAPAEGSRPRGRPASSSPGEIPRHKSRIKRRHVCCSPRLAGRSVRSERCRTHRL